MLTSNDSDKRERNVQTRRLKNSFHTRLSQFCQSRNYPSLFDGLEYVGEVGLDYLEVFGDVPPKIAQKRTEQEAKR